MEKTNKKKMFILVLLVLFSTLLTACDYAAAYAYLSLYVYVASIDKTSLLISTLVVLLVSGYTATVKCEGWFEWHHYY
jgi:hypothetical protein